VKEYKGLSPLVWAALGAGYASVIAVLVFILTVAAGG